MAGVDVGGPSNGKRATNSDINMVPFIDFLFVTIAFLLITAVWSSNARISADAQVPGQSGCGNECPPPAKTLHLQIREDGFGLAWKQGATVLTETTVPKQATQIGQGDSATVRYPDLAKAIEAEWARSGEHRDPSDKKNDLAVLHTDDKMPFREMVAVLDAINATSREVRMPNGSLTKMPAFQLSLASR